MKIPEGFKIVQPESAAIPEGFKVISEAPYRATDGMNTAERVLAGVGRGATEIGQGIKQLGLHAGEKVGLADPETVEAYDDYVREEQRIYGQDLGQTTSGKVGALAGNIAATAIPGGLAVKGASAIPGVARAALPLLSRSPQVARAAAHGGAAGGLGAGTLPAVGEDYWSEKGDQVALGGGVGALTGGLLKGIGQGAEAVLPQNLSARVLNAFGRKAQDTDFAKAGDELVRHTGIELSPAARTGSKMLQHAESAARQSHWAADSVRTYDRKVANQVVERINKTLDDISPNGASTEAVGDHIRGTVRNAVKQIADKRDELAQKEYGAIRELVRGRPILQPTNLQGELRSILEEFDGVQAADAKRVVSWANEAMKNIGQNADVGKAIQNRRFWSNASKGVGNLFKDASPGLQRRIAARVTRAMEKDLDASAEALGGEVGAMLRQANANYRRAMQSIEYVQNSPLGRLMGEEFTDALQSGNAFNRIPPEQVVQRLTRLHPSEIHVVKKILQDQSPDAWQMVKRRVIEDALEESMQAAPSYGADTLAIQGNKFVNALARRNVDAKRLQAMLSQSELDELNYVFEAIKRWGDRTGSNPSGTAAMSQFFTALRGVGAKAAASTAGEALSLRNIAKAMNNPTARRQIIELTRLPDMTRGRRAAAYVNAIMQAKDDE